MERLNGAWDEGRSSVCFRRGGQVESRVMDMIERRGK